MEQLNGSVTKRQNGHSNGKTVGLSNGGLATEESYAPEAAGVPGLSGRDYVTLAVCTGCGFVFGIAAEKARVHVPSVIQQQMVFTQNTMLKAFLAAVTTSIGAFSVLSLLPFTHSLFRQVRVEFGGCVTAKRTVAFAVGGAILGMGMTVSGACPGMVVIQVGSGTENALMTLLGCFTGALFYGVVEPALRGHITTKTHTHFVRSIWLDQLLGVRYLSLAVCVAMLTTGISLMTEYLSPWTFDSMPLSPPGVGLLAQKSWSPIYAGMVMGFLQLPIALAVRDSLGGSSSYCTLISQSRRLSQALPYFTPFRTGLGSWWQVFYWAGAAAGAAVSASMSGMWGVSTSGSPYTAFLGGAMMLFGARLASGCTSGHGLSGLALLSLASFVAVPAMFAGGISLAVTGRLLT